MNSKFFGFLVAGLVLAATACTNTSPLSVSAQSLDTTTTSAGALDLGDNISVTRVRLSIKKISLESETEDESDGGTTTSAVAAASDGGSGGSTNDDDDTETEVRVGPFMVDLSGADLAGGIKKVFDAEIPNGTYDELKLVVGVASSGPGSASQLPEMNGKSVIIEGTIDGNSFTFESELHARQKKETTIVVSSTDQTANVTLAIDPSTWFKAADGSRLDPSDATKKSQIEENVKKSIGANCDSDRDGHDDNGHDGPGHL